MRRSKRKTLTLWSTSRLFPIICLEDRTLPSTLVALVDTGVNLQSSTDQPYYDIVDGYDAETAQPATADGSNISENFLMGAGGAAHGSIVADEIVQGIKDTVNQPSAGNPSVLILPIRDTYESGQYAGQEDSVAIIRGIFYAGYHHASVINLSVNYVEGSWFSTFQYNVPSNPDPSYTNLYPSLQDAINYATSKGSVVVAAGGNHHYDLDSTDTNPSDPTYNGYYPAYDYPAWFHTSDMLVAAAIDSNGNVASDYGPIHVDLGAHATQDATSYAAGYVSGVTGVVAALRPDLGNTQLVTLIKSSVQQ